MKLRNIYPSLRLALIYLAFSIPWIIWSDDIVAKLADNNIHIIQNLQTAKGIVFVISSALLLFFTSLHIYKNLQSTLKNKEELFDKLNALSKAAGEGIIDYDIETDTALINDEMKTLLGIDNSIVSNFSMINNHRIHPDDKARVAENFQNFLGGKTTIWQWEYRYAYNGGYKDIVSRGYVIRDKKTGKPLKVIYALQDVTELRNTRTKYYQQQMAFRQSLSRTMIEAEEKEKDRWALELHDNVCQVLTVAKLYTEEALRTNDDPFIKKSLSMIEKAINDIRHISASIKPPEFSTATLYDAIEGLAESIRRLIRFDFTIEYDHSAENILSTEQKLMVYRVLQEQLNNITKYANASRVDMRISLSGDRVDITVTDDGKGFEPATIKAGIGLRNISSRLQLYSGNLSIHSAPGKGCKLKAHFTIA